MNKCLFNVTVTTHTKYESPSAVYLIREDKSRQVKSQNPGHSKPKQETKQD